MSNTYSSGFKSAAIQKMLLPGGPSASKLSKELGISQTTLSRWVRECANSKSMKSNNQKSPLSWSAEQKFQAILETSNMDEQALGEYLRKHGLHSSNLKEWKESFLNLSSGKGRPRKDQEVSRLEKEVKDLKKNLNRKERALAEMSARIVLLKKSHLIWGDPEDEE